MEGVKFYRNAVDVVYFQRDGGKLYWTLDRSTLFTTAMYSIDETRDICGLSELTFEEFVGSIGFTSLINFYGIIADETGVVCG